MKACSAASERNKGPILGVLQRVFGDVHAVLEIGSGTGQHAVHFAANLPHLVWHTSDLAFNHPDIRAWLHDANLPNLREPIDLDVSRVQDWPNARYDGIYSANTLHIMSWPHVQALFANLPRVLAPRATVCIYGPFNYGGAYTSPSNAQFDAQLRAADPVRGIRDFEAVDALARGIGLELVEDVAMPANNRLLVWRDVQCGR
jgi:SAM-dependent methyltransferase